LTELISATEHEYMISIIGKKRVNVQGLLNMHPKFGKLWSRKGWERLASFYPPPNFRTGWHYQPYQRIRGFAFMRYINPRLTLTLTLTLPRGRYIQQANFGTCYVVARAYSLQQQNTGRAHAGLCLVSRYYYWPAYT